MKEFNLPTLKELTDNAIDPYLIPIIEALKSPSNQHLNRYEQATLVKQMFNRAIRLIAFNFSSQVDDYVDKLNQADEAKVKKEQSKKEQNSTSTNTKQTTQKKTLKELREERAKKSNLNKE